MKQIYSFEQCTPPPLTEASLQQELERRRKNRLTILLAVAGILLQAVLVLFGVQLLLVSRPLAWCVFCYVLLSTVGSSAIAVVYVQKGGSLT